MALSPSLVDGVLLFLGLLDLGLALWVFFFPEGFYRFFFDVSPGESRGLLYRSGGLWLTFALVQFLALYGWRSSPDWLLVVAGVRLSEWIADWVFLLAEDSFSWIGRIGFMVSVPFTNFFAFLFVVAYRSTYVVGNPVILGGSFRPGQFLLDGILVALIVLDVLLAWLAFGDADRLLNWLHGAEGSDPAGLLTRTGGVWLGFAVLQLLVLLGWRFWPALLIILAGARLTEGLADWIYLFVVRSRTVTAELVLSLSPPINLVLAYLFYRGGTMI